MELEERQETAPAIPYFEQLLPEEQEEVRRVVRQLLRQTFLLERKYDKRSGRLQYTAEYRSCSRHLEFIRHYFEVAGITVAESASMGVIYIQGENLAGDKLSRLATLYILALKLIYDEQMESASADAGVYTTLGAVHEKLGLYRLFKRQPSPTEIRRAVVTLRKYQIAEPLEMMEELDGDSVLLIYPCVNLVLLGDDIRALLASFGGEEEESGNGGAIQPQEQEEDDGSDDDEAEE